MTESCTVIFYLFVCFNGAFGTRGSLFCTLLVASGFTALEGKKEKNTKLFVVWESDGKLDCYFLFVCLF